MIGIEVEGMIFLQAVLSGMILYSAYTCIRKFRRILKHKPAAVAVEDVLFWIGMAIFLSVQIYYTSDGSIRWYFVTGVVIGCAVCLFVEKKLKK